MSTVVGHNYGPCQLYAWTVFSTKVQLLVNHVEQTARYRAWESGVLTRDASMPIEDALTICWHAAASCAESL